MQAKHAECNKVDAILCLPELYFKPKTQEELVEYLKLVGDAAPNTPLLYYHIPAFTNVNSKTINNNLNIGFYIHVCSSYGSIFKRNRRQSS